MKLVFDKFKEIFWKGLKFIVPLFLFIFIIQKLYELIIGFLNPIIEILPEFNFFGKKFLDLRALLTFMVFTFLCGLLFRLSLTNRISAILFNL